jgi:hypothetical protein
MSKIANKLTTWLQKDIVLKAFSIATIVVTLISRILSMMYLSASYGHSYALEFYGNFADIVYAIIDMVPSALFVLYAFVWRGKMKVGNFCTLYLICSLATGLWDVIYTIIRCMEWDYEGAYILFYGGRSFTNFLGNIAITALILFGLLSNKSADTAPVQVTHVQTASVKKPLSAADALRLLNEKLELGIVTDEEYKTLRADIIKKL